VRMEIMHIKFSVCTDCLSGPLPWSSHLLAQVVQLLPLAQQLVQVGNSPFILNLNISQLFFSHGTPQFVLTTVPGTHARGFLHPGVNISFYSQIFHLGKVSLLGTSGKSFVVLESMRYFAANWQFRKETLPNNRKSVLTLMTFPG
jgi:hypothetical protein